MTCNDDDDRRERGFILMAFNLTKRVENLASIKHEQLKLYEATNNLRKRLISNTNRMSIGHRSFFSLSHSFMN